VESINKTISELGSKISTEKKGTKRPANSTPASVSSSPAPSTKKGRGATGYTNGGQTQMQRQQIQQQRQLQQQQQQALLLQQQQQQQQYYAAQSGYGGMGNNYESQLNGIASRYSPGY